MTADTPPSTLSIREDTDRQVFGYSFDNECSDWVKVKKGEFKSLSAITASSGIETWCTQIVKMLKHEVNKDKKC